MSKAKLPRQNKANEALRKRSAAYMAMVESLFEDMAKALSTSIVGSNADLTVQFFFADNPDIREKFEELFVQYANDLTYLVSSGISSEWAQSNNQQDQIAQAVVKAYGIKNTDKYFRENEDAQKAFLQRKTRGLNLSQRIWNQKPSVMKELEECISVGIRKGVSASQLSSNIINCLQDRKSLSKGLREKYGVASESIDCQYNAVRLARSEINMAYRAAEQERWRQFDFIKAIEIKVTQNLRHKIDICDDLAGIYPKDFVWKGWHPNCLCYEVPIVASEEEYWSGNVQEERNYPSNFNRWIKDNSEKIKKAQTDNREPLFLEENKAYVSKLLNDAD